LVDTDLRAGHMDLTNKTYRVIRVLIVTRTLGPGDKITAEGLSQRFGVSRTPLREALAQLDQELHDPRNRRNPGSTADLTCAALFVVILEGGWDR